MAKKENIGPIKDRRYREATVNRRSAFTRVLCDPTFVPIFIKRTLSNKPAEHLLDPFGFRNA